MNQYKEYQGPDIFLDLDGVLTDFERHCDETGYRRPDGSPDYERMNCNKWFGNMCAYDGARAFYDDLCRIARVRFLTAPITHPECFGGKAEWIKSFVPEKGGFVLKDLMIVASQDKYLIAKPGRILIDDRLKNVTAWRAAGGQAVHHTGDYAQTLLAVRNIIAKKPNSSPKPKR